MIPQQLGQIKMGTLGNDAGWALTFHREAAGAAVPAPFLTVDAAHYYASIDATLPDGLAPGAYKITIEQFTDDHFALLKSVKANVVVRLYLFWRDANTTAKAYFTNMIGLNAAPPLDPATQVAELRLTKSSRRAGERGYDTELTLEEQAYALLRGRFAGPAPLAATGFAAALRQIATRSHSNFHLHETNPDDTMTHAQGEAGGSEEVAFAAGTRYLAAVEGIANAIQLGRNLYGRGMVLIRDGTVHIGKRPIPFPFPSPDVKDLTLATGLLHSEQRGEEETDPYADTGASATAPPKRAVWTLTLKGRSDLKPGDVVRFEPPEEGGSALPGVGGAIAGAFAAPFLPSMGTLTGDAKLAYVRSVRHTQSRTKGFATVVEGVVIASAAAAWDVWRDATPSAPPPGTSSATPGEAAAEAVRRIARATRLDTRTLEVGEVRVTTTNASGPVEPPAQTQTVREGLARPDGRPNGVRRLPVRADAPTPVAGVAYLTPFAWGGCGLVLPRYPGTRVALGFRNGVTDDPVQLGALWPSGHAPVSEPGDWWLTLPVGVATEKRASVPDTESVGDHTGKVVHDLTDGDGNRVIELGELTVRVGRSSLQAKGTRPARAGDQDSVTIEHTGGAKLVLKQDGSVEITGKKIDLDAGTGTITMKAATVDVQVTNAMEVH
ncbi:MAG: hypothetical protein WBA97_13720 [Actinophytocola sp.]|uniref:hypothetical protein n=1 Tax=Actinophytocola sp. TaxID=1872138 RepID=UPI003C71D5E0